MDGAVILNELIQRISSLSGIVAIGRSGKGLDFPVKGFGDVDIFIYCDAVPDTANRIEKVSGLNGVLEETIFDVFSSEHWGLADKIIINGIEVWLMYFTIADVNQNIDEILAGKHLDRVDNYYYPIGRLAMLKGINILYDTNGFFDSIKKRLQYYPECLIGRIVNHYSDKLCDFEDLERAVIRKDLLFYHFALDNAIDSFMQILFAINKEFFPSRKRNISYIENFLLKPTDCEKRILDIVALSVREEELHCSFHKLRKMVDELLSIAYIYK